MAKKPVKTENTLRKERFEDIVDLATEFKRQATTKLDLVVDPRSLEVSVNEGESDVELTVPDHGSFPLTDWAHKQVSERLSIPKRYYDRMRVDSPSLLAANISEWLPQKERRLLRLMEVTPGEGLKVRAFMSDRYRVLDNEALLHASLQALKEVPGGVDIKSSHLSETKMYIKAVKPEMTKEVRKGERVSTGIVISNSEVGNGGVQVAPYFLFLACQNGMIGEKNLRKVHLGQRMELGEILSENTLTLEDAAIWSAIKDLVWATFDDAGFDKMLDQFRKTAEVQVANPVDAVGNVVQHFKLSDVEESSLLEEFSTSRDYTQYGLFNAVTATAKTFGSVDKQAEWETIGGQLATMQDGQFERLIAVSA